MNLIRNIIGLIITMAILPICVCAFIFVSKLTFDYDIINDEIALSQLRQTLLIAYDMEIEDDSISFRYKNNIFSLNYVNNKLIMQPGTQIILNNIDYVSFIEKDNCIYVNYERRNLEYESIISSAQGFYIDDFSDCDVLDIDDDSSQE